MTLSFIRSLFILLSGVVGYYIGNIVFDPIFGAQIGLLSGLLLIFVETRLHRVSLHGLSSIVFGLLLGILLSKLLADILSLMPLGEFFHATSRIILTLVFSYLGAVMALRGKDEFNVIIPYVRFKRQDIDETVILLDTSAIIDGRIMDIYRKNFVTGRLVVPRCVLQELQRLADSSDDLKRSKGRRGLDLLKTMQEDHKLDLHVHEDNLTDQESVDNKLVRLSKIMEAKICTTDYNLAQIASLQGVSILNLHDLETAIRPVVFIGDKIDIKLVKEGKESNQAVGYLPDGTMIVVSDAQKLIGQSVTVIVSSILQTQSGKMIFGKLGE